MTNYLLHLIKVFKDILTNHAIATTLVLGPIIYGFFYPTAYEGQQVEHLPIVIVDEDQSPLTQQIVRTIEQNPNLNLYKVTSNFSEAITLVQQQHVDAIVLLPSHFSSRLDQKSNGIGLYFSGAYLLRVKATASMLATSLQNVLQHSIQPVQDMSQYKLPISIHQLPLYNQKSGYGSYLFPAVAPLLIHQMLFIGGGMLVAGYREYKNNQSHHTHYLAIFSALLIIGCLGCFYLFGFIYWLYDYPRGGNLYGMLISVPIFISCIVGISLFLSCFFDCAERVGHVLVIVSIPLFLLSGTSWPIQAMPVILQWLSLALPSTQGIQMFIQLNQMAVPTTVVIDKLLYLGLISILFNGLAYYYIQIKPRE